MNLPILIRNRKEKWILFFVGGASTLILYQVTNRMHFVEPRILNFDAVDRAMPFWPWTVWVYFTEYIIFIVAYFGLRSKENVTRYFYSYMAILCVSCIVFLAFPVTFPRANYPALGTSVSDSALNYLRNVLDSPANCLPSLHVSSCLISAFCFWPENRRRAALYFVWSALVAVSTMTTKQHYFMDVWTAVLLTIAAYWLFFVVVKLNGSIDDWMPDKEKLNRFRWKD